jgi:hypothetical protein
MLRLENCDGVELMTDKEDIAKWFRDGEKREFSHLIIVCDTFKNEDYPVYVSATANVREVIEGYDKSMQRVMEVYSYALDLKAQLAEQQAYHLN